MIYYGSGSGSKSGTGSRHSFSKKVVQKLAVLLLEAALFPES
jgi:hypothetical protein